jgi:hypothetical protein
MLHELTRYLAISDRVRSSLHDQVKIWTLVSSWLSHCLLCQLTAISGHQCLSLIITTCLHPSVQESSEHTLIFGRDFHLASVLLGTQLLVCVAPLCNREGKCIRLVIMYLMYHMTWFEWNKFNLIELTGIQT